VKRHGLWIGLAIAAVTLVIDQASKAAVLAHFSDDAERVLPVMPSLNFVLVANHGVSFGMLNTGGSWQAWVFSALALAISAGLVHMLRRAGSWWAVAGEGMIIGGAVGNMIDRLRFGSVVDFVDFYIGSWHWFVFNIADAAICIGVGLLLLDSLLTRPESPKA
jgi:signal peptidase II